MKVEPKNQRTKESKEGRKEGREKRSLKDEMRIEEFEIQMHSGGDRGRLEGKVRRKGTISKCNAMNVPFCFFGNMSTWAL